LAPSLSVDPSGFQVLRELAQDRDDVVPGEHGLHALQGGALDEDASIGDAAGVAAKAEACSDR
jgi:hypothetical protein